MIMSMCEVVAFASFLFAVFNANATCAFIYYQLELPDRVKKCISFNYASSICKNY